MVSSLVLYPNQSAAPTLEKPVKTVILHPMSKSKVMTPKPPPPPKIKPTVIHYDTYIVTAYTNRKSEGTNGVTASGHPTKANHTLSCPPNLALGTTIYIKEFNRNYVCDDRGGAIKGKRLDLFMNDLKQALQFGKKQLHIKIIGGK